MKHFICRALRKITKHTTSHIIIFAEDFRAYVQVLGEGLHKSWCFYFKRPLGISLLLCPLNIDGFENLKLKKKTDLLWTILTSRFLAAEYMENDTEKQKNIRKNMYEVWKNLRIDMIETGPITSVFVQKWIICRDRKASLKEIEAEIYTHPVDHIRPFREITRPTCCIRPSL